MGYLLEKEKKAALEKEFAQDYPAVRPDELNHTSLGLLPFISLQSNERSGQIEVKRPHNLVDILHH
ncbi:hypothetical protein D3C81_1546740 [compost metagenome]